MISKFYKILICPIALFTVFSLTSCNSKQKQSEIEKTNMNIGRTYSNFIDITFDADVGYFGELQLKTKNIKVKRGEKYKYFKSSVGEGSDFKYDKDLYDFKGWYLNSQPVNDEDSFNENATLVAWYTGKNITVTFNAGEGTYSSGITIEKTVIANSKFKDVDIEEPTKSGAVFSHYINDETKEIITPTTKFNKKNISVTAQYVDVGTPSFANDSWEVLIANANKGLPFLKKTYASDITPSNSFVGKERKLTLADKEYTVRVIGEEADQIYNSGNAVLTFEFVDLLSPNQAYDRISSSQGRSNINSYENSSLYKFLNSVYETFPNVLKQSNGVKTIVKATCNGMKKKATVSPHLKLFPLSATEIGLNTGFESLTNAFTYKYYQDGLTADKYVKNYSYLDPETETTIKKALPYWLRSPDSESEIACYNVKSNGELNKVPADINISNGVSAAFCIGEASKEVTVKFDPNGGSWVESEQTPGETLSVDSSTGHSLNELMNIGNIPPKVYLDGYTFVGWYEDNQFYSSSTIINKSVDLKARFIKNDKMINVTLNGGNIYNLTGDLYASKDDNVYSTAITPIIIDDVTYHSIPSDLRNIIIKADGKDITSYDGVKIENGTIIVPIKYATKSIEIIIEAGIINYHLEDKLIEIANYDEMISSVDPSKAGKYVSQFLKTGDILNIETSIPDKIGQTKTCRAVLVEMGHSNNYFKVDDTQVISAMTFDFLDSPYSNNIVYSKNDSPLYLNSLLKEKIDGAYDLFTNDALKKGIKEVNIESYDGVSKKSFFSKMFTLSVTEHTKNYVSHAEKEGEIYSYYNSSISSHIKYLDGMPCNYWLRSAYADYNNKYSFYGDTEGNCCCALGDAFKGTTKAIIPAFCL